MVSFVFVSNANKYIVASQIQLIVCELFLIFRNSFVCSNSNFWGEGRWKINCAAVVTNFMAEHYKFKNSFSLAMRTVTFNDMVWSGDAGCLLASQKKLYIKGAPC